MRERWRASDMLSRSCGSLPRSSAGSVARLDPHIDDRDMRRPRPPQSLSQSVASSSPIACHRAKALRALRARHAGEVDVGIGNALADPAVLDRSVAHAGDALLMQFVVEEGAIVGDDDQQRNAVMRRGPKRGHAHQEIAVAADRDRQPAGAFQRERRADRDAGAAADAAAAVAAEIVERMAERPASAVPRQRDRWVSEMRRDRRPRWRSASAR